MLLDDIELMHYFKADFISNGFKQHSFKHLMRRSPNVELYCGF